MACCHFGETHDFEEHSLSKEGSGCLRKVTGFVNSVFLVLVMPVDSIH